MSSIDICKLYAWDASLEANQYCPRLSKLNDRVQSHWGLPLVSGSWYQLTVCLPTYVPLSRWWTDIQYSKLHSTYQVSDCRILLWLYEQQTL